MLPMGKKYWRPGDTISIRLRKEDQDVADYLNQEGKSTAEELIQAVRLKASIESLETGHFKIKPEHVVLLQEMQKLLSSALSPLMLELLEMKETLAVPRQQEENQGEAPVSFQKETGKEEAKTAMKNFLDW